MRIGFRELVCILVVLAMPPTFWWSGYRKIDRAIESIEAEAANKEKKLEQLEGALKHISDLGKEIDRLSEALNVFEAKLPSEKEVDVILKEVSQLTMRHGLKTKSIRTDKPVKNARYTEIPLKMMVQGDFDGFYSFVLELERLSRITQVPQMKLSKLKGGAEGALEAEFTLSIFFEAQGVDEKVAQAQ
jgi:type IV pilus assembly protein PilO